MIEYIETLEETELITETLEEWEQYCECEAKEHRQKLLLKAFINL